MSPALPTGQADVTLPLLSHGLCDECSAEGACQALGVRFPPPPLPVVMALRWRRGCRDVERSRTAPRRQLHRLLFLGTSRSHARTSVDRSRFRLRRCEGDAGGACEGREGFASFFSVRIAPDETPQFPRATNSSPRGMGLRRAFDYNVSSADDGLLGGNASAAREASNPSHAALR